MRAMKAAGFFKLKNFYIFISLILTSLVLKPLTKKHKPLAKSYGDYLDSQRNARTKFVDLKTFATRQSHCCHVDRLAFKYHFRRPVTSWNKHGYTCLLLSPLDVTIYMDISPNPGPEHHHVKTSPISDFSGSLKQPGSNTDLNNYARRTIVYTKDKLFNLKAKYPISSDQYMLLKDQNLLKTRGVRSGLSVRNKIRRIPPISNHHNSINIKNQNGVNLHNLQQVKRVWQADCSNIQCDIFIQFNPYIHSIQSLYSFNSILVFIQSNL